MRTPEPNPDTNLLTSDTAKNVPGSLIKLTVLKYGVLLEKCLGQGHFCLNVMISNFWFSGQFFFRVLIIKVHSRVQTNHRAVSFLNDTAHEVS